MHLQRIITSLVALPILIAYIGTGGPFLFACLVALAGTIAFWEYSAMIRGRLPFVDHAMTSPGLVLTPVVLMAVHYEQFGVALLCLAFVMISSTFIALKNFGRNPDVVQSVPAVGQGMIYVPVLLSFLVMLRQGEHGVAWVFLALILVAACDTGAYYAGTYFGKHKLIPHVSPGKTWEGFAGGLCLCLLVALAFRWLFMPYLPVFAAMALAICFSVVGPVGDLFESMQKRVAGIKDSGQILPGHGGILDRIDALLFVAPVAYLFKTWLEL